MIKKLAILACAAAVLVTVCGKPKPVEKPALPAFIAGIETIDSMYVASLFRTGPYAEVGKAIGDLMTWAGKNKVAPTGAPFGIYYDDPTKVKPESTRYEICMPVASGTKGDKMVKIKKLDPISSAVTIHVGPYEKVGETYGKLMTWIADNKYEIAGPAREYYLTNPAQVPAESLKTKIALPVKPVSPPAVNK
jgi:AraC family transcriptional regulator